MHQLQRTNGKHCSRAVLQAAAGKLAVSALLTEHIADTLAAGPHTASGCGRLAAPYLEDSSHHLTKASIEACVAHDSNDGGVLCPLGINEHQHHCGGGAAAVGQGDSTESTSARVRSVSSFTWLRLHRRKGQTQLLDIDRGRLARARSCSELDKTACSTCMQ